VPGTTDIRSLRPAAASPGFTLVELLVVVVILGVLAAVAIPMFSGSTEDSKRSALDQDLAILNKAVELYQVEHGGQYPGKLGAQTSWDTFVKQMTTRTDKTGAAGTRYGPYLKTGIPKNPYTGTSTGTLGKAVVGSDVAWRYDAVNGIVTAANDGSKSGGLDPTPGLN
jgi:general secretion pathway protein G